jgi:C_GCAxxG_C_C family probable redox protein
MNKSEVAAGYFKNNFNCSQSVFTAFGPEYGISENNCLKIACAFGAGIARQQYTCGAVTGALMAIGLKFGKGIQDDNSKKMETYQKSLMFLSEFKKRHGSVLCKELLNGLDMNNPDDAKKIEDLRLFQTACLGYVKDAVEITESLIAPR